ncbi:MAG TPA: HNH endonuclease signature motif containing protein, partial [Bdellovibrio sp.]|nr:HNH endonuclease signature motif containing protein [Bdellovibrio sp.]
RAVKEKEKSCGEKISSAQKIELVEAIAGKSTGETQKELCLALDIELKEPERKLVQKDDSVHLTITLSKKLHDKLMKCKDLASHTLLQQQGDVSMNALFEFLADQYLETVPSKKRETTNSKITSSKIASSKVADSKNGENAKVTSALALSCSENFGTMKSEEKLEDRRKLKTLTPKTRREILRRDQCCQYRDKTTGKQCKSTFLLQVDHKTPRWANGNNDAINLQILCAQHNGMKYRNEAGLRFM